MSPQLRLRPYAIIFTISAIALLISIGVYARQGNAYAPANPAPSTRPTLTNPEIMKNWLPDSSYAYTIARIDDYLAQNQIAASSMSVWGAPASTSSTYNFVIKLAPDGESLSITVKVNNSSPILSTAVFINGQLVNPSAPTTSSTSGTEYNNFGSLTNDGLTTFQTVDLQNAFQKFAPSASTITIDPSSIIHKPPDPNSPEPANIFTFSVNVDKANYNATIRCPDLSSLQLILDDAKTGKQVFDSGVLASQ